MTRTISAKLPEDLIEEIEEYQEDDESRSAAVRRLVRAGLEAEDEPDGIVMTYPVFASFLGWFAVVGGGMEANPQVMYAGLAVVVIGGLWAVAESRDYQIPFISD
jgi:hypothetical protein